jgi:hypothetical protein
LNPYSCDNGLYNFEFEIDCSLQRDCSLLDLNGDGLINNDDNTPFSYVVLANKDDGCGDAVNGPCNRNIRGLMRYYACDDGGYSFDKEILCN